MIANTKRYRQNDVTTVIFDKANAGETPKFHPRYMNKVLKIIVPRILTMCIIINLLVSRSNEHNQPCPNDSCHRYNDITIKADKIWKYECQD